MPVKVICHYRVIAGKESAFEELLGKHWSTLNALGFATDDKPQKYKGEEGDGQPIYFEIFDWCDGGIERAHEHPDVMAIWEPMDQLCEERDGKPNIEFPHVVSLND
jgi:hypothetical protein